MANPSRRMAMAATRHYTTDSDSEEAHDVTFVDTAPPTRVSAPTPTQTPTPALAQSLPESNQGNMFAMMETFMKAQAEANRQLIETILTVSAPAPISPIASSGVTTRVRSRSPRLGNFSNCSARFDGAMRSTEVLEAFIDAVLVYKECAAVSDENALRGLPILLTGDAAVWWQGMKRDVECWEDAVAKLRGMYGIVKPAYRVLREIFAHEHTASERSEVFACRIRALMSQLPYDLCEAAKIDIVYGLLHRKIRKRLPRDVLNSLEEMIVKLRYVEESIAEVDTPPQPVSTPKLPSRPSVCAQSQTRDPVFASSTPVSSSPNDAFKPRRKRCSYCKSYGHVMDECRNFKDSNKKQSSGSDLSTQLRCYGCGQLGVIKSKCNTCNSRKVSSNSLAFNTIYCNQSCVNSCADVSSLTHSHSSTHVLDNSLLPRKDLSVISDNNVSSDEIPSDTVDVQCSLANGSSDLDQCHPLIKINIAGCDGVAIVDTGATHCIASPLLHRLMQSCDTQSSEVQRNMRLADGTERLCTVLLYKVVVTLQDREVPTTFLVIPGADTRTLLGRDFIKRAGIVPNLLRGTWSFVSEPGREYDLVHSYNLASSIDANALCADGDVSLLSLRADEGVHLSGEQRAQLGALITAKTGRFATEGEPTSFITHRIKVGEEQRPIASPPYRMSPAKAAILEKELDKLLRSDVIEECESPWAANVVLVSKKDGGTRLCIDYRGLNAITEPDRYPLPRMDDVLHAAKTSNYMSTLDLRSGYFQTSVAEEDRDKTAFVTPLGTFRFKRMPMGLRNSGATFQRLMDRFKSNLPGVNLLCYLDDLIVLSHSFDKHLKDLEAVFDRLELFNLRVNREKSSFARDSVKFLGHLIVPGGIQVDPDKTAAVNDMAVPTNIKHLKCFLQTSSWFRRFIPNYAEIARPLTSLLKKGSVWHWSSDQQSAFDRIKQLLVSAPILRQADHTQPFTLRTDSSGYCLGAVLMQGEGPDERPVEYASRLLSPAERNYTTTEREALAVVWAVTKFRGYIEGTEIVVRSDHQPLRWLMSVKSPSGRLTRWALTLQEFNLRIEYTPGKSNVIADTLSRPTCADGNSCCDLCQVVVDVPSENALNYRELQLRDADVRNIIEDLEAEDDPFRGRPWADRGYIISDGVLYRYNPEPNEDDDACLVVPDNQRLKILSEYHDAPTAGHLGVERTLRRIAARYYWPGMRASISSYVKECVPCQRYKVDTRKPAGLVQSPAVTQRFEVVAVDLFGPLPVTESGNRWILIVEDVCSRWVELFPLENATSLDCAKVLIEEVFLRYGVPRRMISDNGVQFISEVMQQVCFAFGIDQSLTPYYHPEANPVERKNRDLKPQLAIYVGQDHTTWDTHLAAIRFAMNSAVTHSTGFSPAMLTFGREIRAPADVVHDMRVILDGDKFVAHVTPFLKRLTTVLVDARDTHEKMQSAQKRYADEKRRPAPDYNIGELVLLKTQGSNDTGRGQTPKFIPRRDGPYRVRQVLSSTTYCLERGNGEMLGKYHVSQLTPFIGQIQAPVHGKRRRGRPRKNS